MSFQAYLSKQTKWARSLRRHLHLKDNETAMLIWATEGYAKQFADRFRDFVED